MDRRKGYLILQTALCILLAALFSAAAVRIYQEGAARKAADPLSSMYTPENTAEAFGRLSPLLFAALGVMAAGLILGVRDDRASRPVQDPALERDLILSRLGEPGEEVRKEQRRQRTVRITGWAGFGACMIPIAFYCAQKAHFPEDALEAMIASLALRVFPWIGLGIGMLICAAVLERKSILREIGAAKAQLKREKGGVKEQAEERRDEKRANTARILLLTAAVVLIVLGVLNGGLKDVLLKAINICTECVGLG